MTRLSKRKTHLRKIKMQKKANQHQTEVLETCSSNGDEFNDEFDNIEDGDTEVSIVKDEDANNVITKLLQAVPEVTTHRPLVYVGNSVRTNRRRRQLQQKAAIGTPKLESFWTP